MNAATNIFVFQRAVDNFLFLLPKLNLWFDIAFVFNADCYYPAAGGFGIIIINIGSHLSGKTLNVFQKMYNLRTFFNHWFLHLESVA